jgi:protein arginine kinase
MSNSLLQTNPHHDIVISSRVRIARNLENYAFPHLLTADKTNDILRRVKQAVESFSHGTGNRYQYVALSQLDSVERQTFVEDHVISPALAGNLDKGAFFLDELRQNTIMVNEEDHLRIQCVLKGLQLADAWKKADLLDDFLGRHLPYAFDETFGYLTACPTNLGTGVRFSVMLHLPALTMLGHTNGMIHAAGQLGFAVRGVFGEGSDHMGNLYQISNQVTLGIQETEMISDLEDVVLQVIQKERMARKNLLDKQKVDVEDRICRSLGILKYARRLSRKEAMQYLSDLKLGITLGIINFCTLDELQGLIELIQPANLQKHYGELLRESERDFRRAEIIRRKLSEGGGKDVNE